jgi:hypothetical protein
VVGKEIAVKKYLYVIIGIFSRRVVGWCVADKESVSLFTALFKNVAAKHPDRALFATALSEIHMLVPNLG